MATSAAAVDHHMGSLEGGQEMFKDLKVTLGIAMGTSIIGDSRQEKTLNMCLQVSVNSLKAIFSYEMRRM